MRIPRACAAQKSQSPCLGFAVMNLAELPSDIIRNVVRLNLNSIDSMRRVASFAVFYVLHSLFYFRFRPPGIR